MSTEHDGKGLYTALPFDRQRYGKDDQIMAVLYTDTINGEQTCRDDLWLATSTGLRDVYAEGRKDEREKAAELLRRVTQALGDLSFECFGGIGTCRPSIETYNRTFGVLEESRAALAPTPD